MSRAASNLRAFVVIALCIGTRSALGQDVLDEHHTIYRIPKSETHELVLPLKTLRPGTPDQKQSLRWSVELKQNSLVPGEVLWGKLTVTNQDPKFAFRFSPPYDGEYVSTIGVWVSRRDNEKWTELREVIWVSKGQYHLLNRAPNRGKAVTLKSGETYTAWLPLNVCQPPTPASNQHLGPACAWYPGMGMDQPGRYRLYVRYINLEGLVGLPRDDGDTIDVDYHPVVLGPWEVEVVPIKSNSGPVAEANAKLAAHLRSWNSKYREPVSDVVRTSDVRDVSDIAKALAVDQQLAGLCSSLLYTAMREGKLLEDIPIRTADPEKLDVDVRNEQALLSCLAEDDPLRDHVRLTLCRRLYERGRIDEALAAARKIKTSDAEAFLDRAKPAN